MIPPIVQQHLTQFHPEHEHHRHPVAMTAQDLAHAEHISGYRVAKAVVIRIGGDLALAVVAATDRVNLARLEEATASTAEIVSEAEFADRFTPCDPGAEPPLALFGVQIFVDERLLREDRLLMPAGTHEDSVALDTHAWIACERVQAIANLGLRGAVRVHWDAPFAAPGRDEAQGRRPV